MGRCGVVVCCCGSLWGRSGSLWIVVGSLWVVVGALIMPHFDYCSLVWDNCSKYLLEKLQKLQNRAARVIIGKSYETRSSEIVKNLGWQPLLDRRKDKRALFMYKVKNNEFPESQTSMLNTSNNKNLRSNELDFALPKPNTNYLKKSFSYSGAALWNDLPSAQKIEQYQLVSSGLFSITWKNELVNRVIPFITFYTFFRISPIVCNICKVLFFCALI